MVIIITGTSHTGKTVLAQRLLERLHYPYLSIDHLKMGLIRSGNTSLTPLDDDELTAYLWPIVREMIKTAIENDQDLIVEGCYIPFEWRKDLDQEYAEKIRFICLAFSEEYIRESFDVIKSHGCDIESRLDDGWLNPEILIEENRRYIEGFSQSGEEVTVIERDYVASIEDLIGSVSENV